MVKRSFIEIEDGEPGLLASALRSKGRAKTDSQLLMKFPRGLSEVEEEEEKESDAAEECSSTQEATTEKKSISCYPTGCCRDIVSGKIFQCSQEERTTIMLRNLPNNYTREMLLRLLGGKGFSGTFDFLYLPMDMRKRANLGYAFINCLDPGSACEIWKKFDGFGEWCLPSNKICQVSWSDPLQGLEAHIDRYKNSPMMHASVPDEYKPMVFSEGKRQAFPPATKKLKPPFQCRQRLRHPDPE